MESETALSDLLLVPLEDTVVFPGMTVTLAVDAGDEDRVLLVPRHDSEYAKVGTVAEVADRVRLPGGATAVALTGLHRAVIGAAHTDSQGRLRVEAEERIDDNPPPVQTRELEREYRAVVEEILELRDADDRIRAFLRSISDAGALADTCAYAPDISFKQRVDLLEKVDIVERLQLALELQRERLAEYQVRRRIREDVETGAAKQQREYVLRKQMESIRKELGEDEGSLIDEYRQKIEEAGMPDDVRAQADRELRRLETMGDASGEASMIRTYLDWLTSVPWSKRSDERLDPKHAREVLDADHAGLEVLDPAQNHSCRDHYLDVELDLSDVFFIATGNVPDTIPGALLDRMEVIRFDGYTVDEKTAIARDYLWPRQRERNGLREDEVTVTDETLKLVVSEYTREAGVRQLERSLGTLLRKVATKIASAK